MTEDQTEMLPVAHEVHRQPSQQPSDTVMLDYDGRFLRRKRLQTASGARFLVDLDETTNLDHGDAFVLDDGRLVGVVAAPEDVLVITGDLARLAWHIGNRHTPCQIEPDRLVIRHDHVLDAMLAHLGATLIHATERFTPEGGAYGMGRTMGHDHAPTHAHVHVHHHGSHQTVDDAPEDEAEPL